MQDALKTFLLRKLDNLAKDDKCQITMISTWATELYLDKVWMLHIFLGLTTSFLFVIRREEKNNFSHTYIKRQYIDIHTTGTLD